MALTTVLKKGSKEKNHQSIPKQPRTQLKTSSPISQAPYTPIIQRKPACPCDGGCPSCISSIQPKLELSQPGNIYEQEANRIAHQVMHMPESYIQRQTESEEKKGKKSEEGIAQTKPIITKITSLDQNQKMEEINQTKEPKDQRPKVTSALETKIQSLRGGGRSLSQSERAFFEPRFGYDFSQVRLHTSSQAKNIASGLKAQAFTHRNNIFWGPGTHSPGTALGNNLLAHELTHVIQQRSASAKPNSGTDHSVSTLKTEQNYPVQRQPAAPEPIVEKPPDESLEIAPEMMNLQDLATFDPPASIAQWLDEHKKGKINVSLGNIARGDIVVEKTENTYEVKKQAIHLSHPFFSRFESIAGLEPSLILQASKGVLTGYVSLGVSAENSEINDLMVHLKKTPDLIGLAGFDLSKIPKITNKLEGGQLNLGINGQITLGNAFSGTFNLNLINEKVVLEGNVGIKVKGLASGNLELKRSEKGVVTGKADVNLDLPKNFSGSIDVIWDGRAITGEGKVAYQGEKLSGEVILRLMEKSQAEQLEAEKKAPAGEVGASPTKKDQEKKAKIDYVVFGEGDLTFAFTDWLNGVAHVIVDPKGDVTIIGKITPQKEFILFKQKNYTKDLFKVEARVIYGVPIAGNIFIYGNVGMDAFAYLGPAKFYNIIAEGTYSTDPKKCKEFSIQGSLNISATAGLRLRGEAGAGAQLLAHDIKAGAGINGIATIRGYAEATPVIGYREKAKKGEDKKGEFFIRGDLEIAAQPILGLSGDLFVEVDAPWWSPCPDKRWTWPLGSKEWPMGGGFGINASIDYVIGSDQPPALEFKPVEFSADKFMTDLYSNKAKAKSGEAEHKGTWKDKNSKDAEPPPKKGAKGGAPVGRPPKLAPAKPKVKPGEPKKRVKPAEPNARTEEGKRVKEYMDEATKEGKKPKPKVPTKEPEKEEITKAPAKKTPEEQLQLQKGLAALDAVTKRYKKDGASKKELVTGVKAVRRKFKVFESIEVVDGGKTWNYEYVACEGELPGPPKAELSPSLKEARDIKVGDYVILLRTKQTFLVTETNVTVGHEGNTIEEGLRGESGTKRNGSQVFVYSKFGKHWKNISEEKPTYKKFHPHQTGKLGVGGQVTIDREHLKKKKTSPSATPRQKEKMHFGDRGCNVLGHLVANVFTGPNAAGSGNIVPVTKATNDKMWIDIEKKVRDDLKESRPYAVYRYEARPLGNEKPPRQIQVTVELLFPSKVPRKPEIFDNK